MSERELREGAIQTALDKSFVCVYCLQYADSADEVEHSPDCPVMADPDLVKVLRWLVVTQADFEKLNMPDVWNTYEHVRRYTESTFHICLTDDGWEYTEEET
jgi:hypothetical protein